MPPPNPPGWHTLPVEVASDGKTVLIVGEPPDESEDPECERHHCDSMGCGLSHILARFALDGPAWGGLRHLIDRAEKAEPPPGPSLREQVLARLGRTKDDDVVPPIDFARAAAELEAGRPALEAAIEALRKAERISPEILRRRIDI